MKNFELGHIEEEHILKPATEIFTENSPPINLSLPNSCLPSTPPLEITTDQPIDRTYLGL